MPEPTFEVAVPSEVDTGETLVVGVADVGVAGLTAVDYLASHGGTTRIGHVGTRAFPDITPFADGRPRHPMRLYALEEPRMTLFVSEVFLPVWAADPVTDALFEWVSNSGIEEVVVLFGAPFPHAEHEHAVFHVSTDEFRERHVADSDIDPLPGGFFDGVVGELVTRGLDADAPATGVLVTPAHVPGPDIEGALRLLDGLRTVYGVDVDRTELEERSEEMKRYYQELANRMEALREGDQPLHARDYPEDRMYM